MQNIIVSKINGDVTDPFDTGVVLPFFVGKKDTVAALQFGRLHVFPLLYLRTGVYLQQLPCALIKNVLYKGRTIEFLRGESAEKLSVSVVQTYRTVNVRHADEFIPLGKYVFHVLILALFQR